MSSAPIPPDKYSALNNFIQSNITFVVVNLSQWSDGGCPISGYSVRYRSRRTQYHRSLPANNHQMSGGGGGGDGWIPLSTHLMPEKDTLVIRELQPGTWHDLAIAAQNDAGRREAEYSFATLTELGATVEPLHAFESRMGGGSYGANGGGGGYAGGSFFGAAFDDPMIFVPALCTILVLVVVTLTSAFLYVMRIRHDTLQMSASENDTCEYCCCLWLLLS